MGSCKLLHMQVPTGFEVLSLVILTLGVLLSIWEGSIAGSPSGICIAVASTFCGAAMLSFSGKVGGFKHYQFAILGMGALRAHPQAPAQLWQAFFNPPVQRPCSAP